jgi:hypothetical protein
MSGAKSLVAPLAVAAIVFVVCLIMVEVEGPSHALQQCAVRAFYAIGGLVSAISVIVLIFRVSGGEPAISLVPWAVVFLAGILMVSFHWGVAVSLAGIAIASIVREGRGRAANDVGKLPTAH